MLGTRNGQEGIAKSMSSKPIVQDAASSRTQSAEASRALGDMQAKMSNATQLKRILADVLGLDPEDAEAMTPQSGLFGHLPELDSMAVAGLLTEIEDRLDIVIEDDDVDGEMLETFGALLTFIHAKTAQA